MVTLDVLGLSGGGSLGFCALYLRIQYCHLSGTQVARPMKYVSWQSGFSSLS